jgi:soluble lytic murein transglycosylase-like protein
MEPLLRVLLARQHKLERCLRWIAPTFVCLVVLSLSGSAASRTIPEPSGAEIRSREAVSDPVYNDFLKEFRPLRRDSKRRQSLVAQILSAAAEHQVDPDLLFSLIAVESGFNSKATSSKGARGLGQVMPTTARAIAPDVIRHSDDLYDIHRNLYVTAQEVRRLLDKWTGDVWGALNEYASGAADRRAVRHNQSRYVARICMYYALLKSKRHYHELVAVDEGQVKPAKG